MRTFTTVAEIRPHRIWFWVAFTVSFVCMGLVLPSVFGFWLVGWAFAFGAGISPFWILLAYPIVIGLAWLATSTNPERSGPQGTLCGSSWGLALFVLLAVVLLVTSSRGRHSVASAPRVSVASPASAVFQQQVTPAPRPAAA
jgi:hypothetical protein